MIKKYYKYVKWRYQYFIQGSKYPSSYFDPAFWINLLPQRMLHSSDYSRNKKLNKLLTRFNNDFREGNIFSIPVIYGGERKTLNLHSNGKRLDRSLMIQFLDLVRPFMVEADKKERYDAFIKKHAYGGKAYRYGETYFKKFYWYPIGQEKFWIDEGSYVNDKTPLQKSDVVYDVGANQGVFSCFAAMYAKKVIAFEPLKKYRDIIRANNELNMLTNVDVKPYGLADSNKDISTREIGMYSASEDAVKVCRASDLVRKGELTKPDFVKMDIEGNERYALEGLHKMYVHNNIRSSICIYHLPDDEKKIRSFFESLNMNVEVNKQGKKLHAW